MRDLILVMNRAVERKVAFENAYFIVMGDVAEVVMVQKIANHDDASQQLKARAWRWLMNNIEV